MGLVFVLALGGLYSFRESLVEQLENYLIGSPEEPIPTMPVKAIDYSVVVRARGKLTGLRTTPVRAPSIRGSLKVAWLREEGTLVKSGDLLVRFDNTDALLTLQENQNTVQTYDSRIHKNELDRDTELQTLLRDGEAADLGPKQAYQLLGRSIDSF